jgi:transcription antitermination factor NusG
VIRKFKRNHVVVEGIDSQWDADTMDMSSFASNNDGYKHVLLMIDIFSRYVWVEPLKTKTGKEMVKAMTNILSRDRRPLLLRSDKGTEFLNHTVSNFLDTEGIKHFVTQNEVKANYAERAIQTIKKRISRYFTYKQTHRYIDVLAQIVTSYNGTFHRSIQMAPQNVNKLNESEVRLGQYLIRTRKMNRPTPIKKEEKKKKRKKNKFKFKIGDTVRISHIRSPFTRAYDEKWSGELFKVFTRELRESVPVYKLNDLLGEEIKGTFYQEELQGAHLAEDHVYKISKILRSRKKGKQKEVLVRWMYWPPKYDSWIPASEVQDLEMGDKQKQQGK